MHILLVHHFAFNTAETTLQTFVMVKQCLTEQWRDARSCHRCCEMQHMHTCVCWQQRPPIIATQHNCMEADESKSPLPKCIKTEKRLASRFRWPLLIHFWTPTTDEPLGHVWPYAKGLELPIRPTAPHLAPDCWIWFSTTQHWSGNCLSSSAE